MPHLASPLRLLVVDDNHDIADVMADLFRIDGHEVRVAYSGSHALDIANEFLPQIVVVDITMPELDGFDTTALLRRQSRAKNAVFVAHTAKDRTELSRRSDVVFDFYVRKPAMGEEFAAAIELARNFEPAQRERLANTLGDVLYSRSRVLALEAEWVALVRSVAAGNQGALHALYTRAHRPVFTLIMRILAARGPAEEVTLDVFHDVWRRADDYDAADTTVLGWMMNLAHSRATERQRLDVRKKRARREVKDPTVVSSAASPAELLRPSASLQERLAQRIKTETNDDFGLPPKRHWSEPEWEEVSPGIFCKLLATDAEKQRVSMLVRLLPGVEYPPHTHAEFEELHLLDGELWIDERKLRAGAYNRAEAATRDKRVWSETGCICVLVTSTADVLD